MELWTVRLMDYSKNLDSCKTYQSEGEAVENARILVDGLRDDGYEQITKNNGSVIELAKDGLKYEISICKTSQFETAPEIVVNDYTYSDRYILEVMHDFKAQTANLYVYDRETPDMKVSIAQYDLKDGAISDSEIMAIAAVDLDDALAALALLNSL